MLELLPRFFVNIVKDNAKTLSYLKAQPCIPRSTSLSANEIITKVQKSERWVVKWSSRNEGFEKQETILKKGEAESPE